MPAQRQVDAVGSAPLSQGFVVQAHVVPPFVDQAHFDISVIIRLISASWSRLACSGKANSDWQLPCSLNLRRQAASSLSTKAGVSAWAYACTAILISHRSYRLNISPSLMSLSRRASVRVW